MLFLQRNWRVMATSLILVAAVIFAYRSFNPSDSRVLDQSSFYDAVREGRVREVTMVPDEIGFKIRGTLSSERRSTESFTTYVLADRSLTRILSEQRVPSKKPG